jgi:formiminoglutamase
MSSSAAGWSSRLEPVARWSNPTPRPDDPRLGERLTFWSGGGVELRPGQAVILGFPHDEGISRNAGRPGTAEGPEQIRHWLYRLTPWDGEKNIDLAQSRPLELGNIKADSMEAAQDALGEVLAAILQAGAVPIILGGGHEQAYGSYLGYVAARKKAGIINIDAHLDVRPCLNGKGHCGSPFRQALEHPNQPLPGPQYVCLGAQPHSTAREHLAYARERGCVVRWCSEVTWDLAEEFAGEVDRLAKLGCQVHVSIDADAIDVSDMPGVSAPNVGGLGGEAVLGLARLAGRLPTISSLDLVEINPRFDRDGQSARWGALAVWHFLAGVARRGAS